MRDLNATPFSGADNAWPKICVHRTPVAHHLRVVVGYAYVGRERGDGGLTFSAGPRADQLRERGFEGRHGGECIRIGYTDVNTTGIDGMCILAVWNYRTWIGGDGCRRHGSKRRAAKGGSEARAPPLSGFIGFM
jgi:hypothetical protein